MSGKSKSEPPVDAPVAAPGAPPVPVTGLPCAMQARVEALKIAIEMRSASTPARTVIANAKEYEAYIVTGERRSPADGEAAGD